MSDEKTAYHPNYLRVILGSSIAPLSLLGFRIAGQYQLASMTACVFVAVIWLFISFTVFRELWTTSLRIKKIICPAILEKSSGLLARICQSNIGIAISSFLVSAGFGMALLVFSYTIPITYFIALIIGAILFSVIRAHFSRIFGNHFKHHAVVVTRRVALTSVIVFVLMAAYISTLFGDIDPSLRPSSPELVNMVVNTITHDCKAFQDLARTSYFIDLTLQSTRNIEEISGWLYVAILAIFISAVPIVGFVMYTRFFYELALPRSQRSRLLMPKVSDYEPER